MQANRKCLKEPKKAAKEGANIAMEILVDMHTEKSKLAEDLSKIRMAEAQDVCLSNSNDEEITEQRKNCSVSEYNDSYHILLNSEVMLITRQLLIKHWTPKC